MLWRKTDLCRLILTRASPAMIAKIAIKKVQISILATHFSIHTPTDYLFYYLFSLNIILCWKECERKRWRERVKERERGRENNKKLFVV
jgi:hypothetical protein